MKTTGYIYILTNASNKVLYIGVTSDLARRIAEHAEGRGSVFTQKYNCHKLVYFEVFPDIARAGELQEANMVIFPSCTDFCAKKS